MQDSHSWRMYMSCWSVIVDKSSCVFVVLGSFSFCLCVTPTCWRDLLKRLYKTETFLSSQCNPHANQWERREDGKVCLLMTMEVEAEHNKRKVCKNFREKEGLEGTSFSKKFFSDSPPSLSPAFFLSILLLHLQHLCCKSHTFIPRFSPSFFEVVVVFGWRIQDWSSVHLWTWSERKVKPEYEPNDGLDFFPPQLFLHPCFDIPSRRCPNVNCQIW